LATDRIILGIDPGTNIMGYGIIHQQGNTIRLITMGVLKLAKYDNHPLKLKKIFERTVGLIEEYHPDEMALEAPFFGKNVQSMLKLGRAQGVAMAAGLHKNVPIFEYSPKKVKMSVVGSGNASKEQVAAMLKTILNFKEIPKYLDATDGVAVAVCHFFQGDKPQSDQKNYNSWKSFVSENPKRTKK
jgi:crossover junction endodeoxyribonuclease RuvC